MTHNLDFKKIEALRKHLLISKSGMAKIYDVSRVSYHGWLKGKTLKEKNVEKITTTTKALLAVMVNSNWPNSAVYEMSDTERVEKLLELIAPDT